MIGGNSALPLVLAALVGAVSYLIWRFIQRRSVYRNLPCPPHSMLWGHLKLVGEYTQRLPPGAYFHSILTMIKEDFDLPDIFYIDLWPVSLQFMVCTSPDACAISTTINAFRMPDQVGKTLEKAIGSSFIEGTNDSIWKQLHSMLAPGLTPGAMKMYHQSMINEAVALHNRFRDIVKSGRIVDMRSELGIYPFQVISTVLFGETMDLQMYKDSKRILDIQTLIMATQNPIKKWQLERSMSDSLKRIDTTVKTKARARFAELQEQKEIPATNNATSLIDRMLLPHVQSKRPLEDTLVKIIMDNVKGFLVAGYGTTTDTSSYMFMLLSVFPEALEKLREEHNRVFDKSFDKTVTMLRNNPGLIKQLEYTTAFISETLRLFPIGMLIREPPKNTTTLMYKEKAYHTKDHVLAICSQSMHYSSKYFEKAKEFRPERFMTEEPTFPRNAYRPFERGLRACLGQSLAMDEMKVMLLLVVRWIDFELKDHKPVKEPMAKFTDLDTKLGIHAFQNFSFTATPAGPVMMKLSSVS